MDNFSTSKQSVYKAKDYPTTPDARLNLILLGVLTAEDNLTSLFETVYREAQIFK